jgi:acetolactate synthase I/II/III large subunit
MSKIKRRQFLAGVAAAGPAIGLAGASKAAAQTAVREGRAPLPAPQEQGLADLPPQTEGRSGSDFMIDVLKSLNIDYVAGVPSSTCRGMHESIIDYANNTKPEFITTLHEDTSAALCHGYYKVAKKPMACMVHGTVGLQHATMAIYNAYADRVPMLVLSGIIGNSSTRQMNVEWNHSAQDQAVIVRDFTKWDDQPHSLQGWAEATVRAYDLMTTVPMGPVLITSDSDLQEDPIPKEVDSRLSIPKLKDRGQPVGDPALLREAARMLVAAEHPVIYTNRYARTENGPALLVQLAEALQAPVVDDHGRMNIANRHPLNHSARRERVLAEADVILALEPVYPWALTDYVADLIGRPELPPRRNPNLKVIHLGSEMLLEKSNFGDIQRYFSADLSIPGDGEASMPTLIEAVNREAAPVKDRLAARGKKLREASAKFLEGFRHDIVYQWDTKPISSGRLTMELWEEIKNEPWMMATETQFVSDWPYKMWNIDKPYQTMGGSGAQGIGYNTPAALGAALANKDMGRVTVAMVGDGDFNMAPGVLWTATHHKIPILYLVHNNRAYHQEVMMVLKMAARRMRQNSPNVYVGTRIDDPAPNYAKIAEGYGMYAEGPVTDPKDLAAAIKRAMDVVRRGEPALIDVVCDGR